MRSLIAEELRNKDALSASVIPRSTIAAAVKRALDLAIAALSLAVSAPILAILALLVKLHDGGPIIYRRRVVGRSGNFDAYKFRSMRVDADAVLVNDPALRRQFETNVKLVADPRVTSVGGFLRKFSLDELPQLVNVVKGQMSLVGPRMISPPELERYGEAKALLLSVRPGLTGYWQVYGRQRVDYAERVRMDVFYIQNWSLALDLKLLLLTPMRVLKGTGAY
ncbi:MAG TPA: sugar transferase [Terriglobales bacterium]|nr:sugar transferase [Terriglobales bacterium]